jgi:hypothetical protein
MGSQAGAGAESGVIEFEPEFVLGLKVFEEMVVFNKVLGLQITKIDQPRSGSIAMKPELVGHFSYNRVHGA